MKVSPILRARRRVLGLTVSGAVVLGFSIGGCGSSSENKVEPTAEAKKAVMTNKVGDPSKFVKPKPSSGKRR